MDFDASKTINEIDVFTVQDSFNSPLTPTLSMTCTTYGIKDFEVQYWNGTSWVDVTGGLVTGNDKVWRQFLFAAITTTKIRVTVTASQVANDFSRIIEVEAWTP